VDECKPLAAGVTTFTGLSVVQAIAKKSGATRDKSRGYAFAQFGSHGAAARALRGMQAPQFLLEGLPGPPMCSWASPPAGPTEPGSGNVDWAKVRSVFVRVMPPWWDEAALRSAAEKFGAVESVAVGQPYAAVGEPGGDTAVGDGAGFVTFAKREAAESCVEGLNGTACGRDPTPGADTSGAGSVLRVQMGKKPPPGSRGGQAAEGKAAAVGGAMQVAGMTAIIDRGGDSDDDDEQDVKMEDDKELGDGDNKGLARTLYNGAASAPNPAAGAYTRPLFGST
jgi:hypothetical protein